CVASLVNRRLALPPGEFLMDSPAGRIRARVREDGLVSDALAEPDFDPASLPFAAAAQADRYELEAAGATVIVGAVSIGTPHAVLRVDSVATAPLARFGAAIEHHERFPKRTNVEFMEIVDRGRIRLRVHERGVGETQACGTGA